MKLKIAQFIIFMLLCCTFFFCNKESTSSNSEIQNTPPEIVNLVFSPSPPLELANYDRIEIQVIAEDPDGDNLSYSWESSADLANPVGSPLNQVVMLADSIGTYTLKSYVSDGRVTTKDSVQIEVVDNSIVLPENNLTFDNHIQPLFRLRCGNVTGGCHSYTNISGPPAKRLDIISYQQVITHLVDESVPLVNVGDGENSFLYQILLGPVSAHPQMPKNRIPLTANNADGIKTWINEGAQQ